MASVSKPDEAAEVIYLHGVRYERDPLSAVFEDLPDEELEMLAENIKTQGQKLPITINSANGLVLDGWQRLRACELNDMEPIVDETEVLSPAAFVMSINESRRGSTAPTGTQRALLATDLLMLEWKARGGKGRKPTKKEVARTAGCSESTVEHVRRALRWDAEHNSGYESKMRSGQMSASSVRDEIVAAGRGGKDQVTQPRDDPSFEADDRVRSISEARTTVNALGAEDEWIDELLGRLLDLTPTGFEQFTANFLKDVGYEEVHVTPPSGDGGVDGTARAPLASTRVAFQCKRYEGSVGAPAVRDFRGAVDGRCESGLFITTGTFTREAANDARRNGAKRIDLIDGKNLCDRLKERKIGVSVRMVEEVVVDHDFFDQFEDAG